MRRWSVLLGCFIGMGVAPPATFLFPLGLFLKSVTAEFGWSRTQFTVILSIAALSNAVAMPVAGYLVDRFGAPRIIAVGTALGCGSFAALSAVNSYAGFIILAVSGVTLGTLASYPAFMGLTQRWFDKRLGLALAITATGIGVGTAGFSYLINTSIGSNGWRSALTTVGAVAAVIGFANLFFLIRENKGPMPDPERREETVLIGDGGSTLGEALRTGDFWLYSTAFTLVIFALVGCNFHLPALLADRGATLGQLSSIVAIGTIGSLGGRLFTGFMLDRISALSIAAMFLMCQVAGFLMLLDGLRWALPAGFLLGVVQGAEIDMLGYVIARRFGRLAYARIFGACFAVTLLGATTGPIAMAAIFDRTNSYDRGLALLLPFPVAAFLLLSRARYSRPRTAALAPAGAP